MNRLLKLFSKGDGQSTVEFALILPVLLLILLGIIEFGWLFSSRIIITSAAREGARVYAISGSTEQAEDAVLNYSSFVDIQEPHITYAIEELISSGDTIEMATVNINTPVEPLVRFIVRQPINMRASASMRVEFVDP